jgi:hypothetical protein
VSLIPQRCCFCHQLWQWSVEDSLELLLLLRLQLQVHAAATAEWLA